MRPSRHTSSARWMAFSSSRTLPGQRCAAAARRRLGDERGPSLAVARARVACQEVPRQQRDVARGRSRSGGELDRDDVEAVVEVLAEAARRDRVVADRRWSRRRRGRRPARLACRRRARPRAPAARAAASPASASGRSPISSRNSVPPCGGLEPAGLASPIGAGEGALLVAEQLALEQRLRQRAAVDGDEGPARARRSASWMARATTPCRCRSRRAPARSRRWARSARPASTGRAIRIFEHRRLRPHGRQARAGGATSGPPSPGPSRALVVHLASVLVRTLATMSRAPSFCKTSVFYTRGRHGPVVALQQQCRPQRNTAAALSGARAGCFALARTLLSVARDGRKRASAMLLVGRQKTKQRTGDRHEQLTTIVAPRRADDEARPLATRAGEPGLGIGAGSRPRGMR